MNYLKGWFHITLSGGKKEVIEAFKHETSVYRVDDGMEIIAAGQFQVEMCNGKAMTVEGCSEWAR